MMKITEPKKPTLIYVLSVAAVFFISGLSVLYFTITIALQFISEISNNSYIFTFDKGSFYLYGVGSGLITLSIVIFYSRIVNNKVSDLINKLFYIFLIGSVLLIVILPQLMHFYVDSYTEKNNYKICNEQSHRWLHVVTIIYAKDGQCSKGS